ncbi:hypothetical protein F511_37993 [Dorcoceras hygrometricum]|uniref:Uncharacterized protein n=1 Tax=Dorcoceras hygrometricum TaxID=472368 RepID=A0A2Z7C348_9LAMI|nr:hypothetical protein F511_37993 [Dorcoceras hygrometricum]
MGLKFPILRFITSLCQYLNVSPSQLAPNSYSFLLSLGVLLSFFDIPLTTYVLMQLIQRDNVYTLSPSTPDRAPDLTPFLTSMGDKCYNAPELVKEDLLCHFGFSKKWVQLIGDLAERMGKAAMLKALKARPEEGSSRAVAPPSIKKGKRKVPPAGEKRAQRSTKKKASTSETRLVPTSEKHDVPSPDARSTPHCQTRGDQLSHPGSQGGSSRQSLDEVLEHHTELAKQLEEMEAIRADERMASEARWEALEAERKALVTEKEALAVEKEALVAELAETRARAEGEIQHLKGEAENAWGLGKEEFLSSEFDDMCAEKSLAYFESGFKGCLAQFRANCYTV